MQSLLTEKLLFLAASCLSLLPLGMGCVLDEPDDAELVVDEVTSELWTGWTSEELTPVTCTDQRLVRGSECWGGYCDNIRLDCVTVAGSFGGSSWSTPFSEEGYNERICGPDEWVTGISCAGHWCDAISIECKQVMDRGVGDCVWAGPFSEESGPFHAPLGWFVRGVKCEGRFCDDLSYWMCQLL